MMQRNAHINGNRVRMVGPNIGLDASSFSSLSSDWTPIDLLFSPQSTPTSGLTQSSGISPIPVSLPLNSSPYAPQDSSLLQTTQLSPHSSCVSPRPSSSSNDSNDPILCFNVNPFLIKSHFRRYDRYDKSGHKYQWIPSVVFSFSSFWQQFPEPDRWQAGSSRQELDPQRNDSFE